MLTFEFNPKELLIAAAGSDRVIRIYDTEEFKLRHVSSPEPHPVGR
jgi:WD40 repeat protein